MAITLSKFRALSIIPTANIYKITVKNSFLIKLNFIKGGDFTVKLSEKFKTKGLLGSFLLGALFALAFCPYSGALFFAMLILMTLSASAGLAMPVVFSFGTGLELVQLFNLEMG